MQKLTIAIAGCGSFGSQMADLLSGLPEYEIVAACDSDGDRARAIGEKFGVRCFQSYEECLAQSGAAAVFIFTPNSLHCPMTVQASKAGKHVFCEKPMAMNVEECYRMIEATDAANVRLTVGHKRRLRPQYRKMAEAVRNGRIGRVLAVNINGFFLRDFQGWWRRRDTGGGLLQCAGVHDIDFLRSICGEAASVYARTAIKTDHRTDFEDAISVMIQFVSAAVATLEVCPFSPMLTFRQSFGVHIVLERGAILYDPAAMDVHVQEWNEPVETYHFDNEAGFREAFTAEFTSYATWVLRGEEPLLTGWDGLRCVEIMEAATLSAYSGREVQLPLPRTAARQSYFHPVSRRGLRTEPELWARGFSMAEGPAFDRESNLYVANCRSDYVSKISPEREVRQFVRTGGKTQGVAIHPDGRLYITDHALRKIFRATPDGNLSDFCSHYADGSALRGPNEIAFGPNGVLYFTDPGTAWLGRPTAALAMAGTDGKARLVADGLEFSNGIDFSPDGSTIYVVETAANRILRAPLRPDGKLANPLSEFVHFDGQIGPDGIRFARNGELYVTLWGHGEIAVVSVDGAIVDRIQLPGLFPTNLIFLGTDLLVCEAQTAAIWKLPVGIEGVPSYAQRMWQSETS
jgi:predicted dehydrogenase/sugar lactone lactonase YvrE